MPEDNVSQAEELNRLRATNADLLAKKQSYKTRIVELETANGDLTTKLAARDAELHAIRVDQPLMELASDISNLPEVFKEHLSKHYDVQNVDGKLRLLSKDGKQITDANGSALPFDKPSLTRLLTADKHPESALFKTIIIVSRASGGAGNRLPTPSPESGVKKPQPEMQFGLR